MIDFFASLYEWFGMSPFYSTDMGDHLRGWDITCTDYIGTPWYVIIGWSMFGTTALLYALQYHIIDSSRYKSKGHWWIFAIVLCTLNLLIGFLITNNALQAGDVCNRLNITVSDCLGFGISNAIWSLLLFVLVTSIPIFRRFSNNCRHTTFWKP